jgi:hypothetical protein
VIVRVSIARNSVCAARSVTAGSASAEHERNAIVKTANTAPNTWFIPSSNFCRAALTQSRARAKHIISKQTDDEEG